MKKSLASFLAVALLLVLSLSAQADVFMKQKHHTDAFAMMGKTQPAKDTFASIWFGDGKVRSDQDKNSTILLLDKKVIYIIDHGKKTYMEVPLDFTAPMNQQMPASMGLKVTVTATGASKKINNWSCKKYLQKMEIMGMNVDSEIWATEDLKMDPEIYSKFISAGLRQNPAMRAEVGKMVEEMKKIKGVQVQTFTTNVMMGQSIKSTVELVEFKEGTAPAGTFTLPAGYTKAQMPSMGGMQ